MSFHPNIFAEQTGLAYDRRAKQFWGVMESVPVSVRYIPNRNTLVYRLHGRPAASETSVQEALEAWKGEHPSGIHQLVFKDRTLFCVASIAGKDSDKTAVDLLSSLFGLAVQLCLEPCCVGCGTDSGYTFWVLDGDIAPLCEACVGRVEDGISKEQQEKAAQSVRVPGVLAGCVLGLLLELALTYVVLTFSRLSFLSAFAALAAALLMVRKLGKKVTLPGTLLCAGCCLIGTLGGCVLGLSKDLAAYHREAADSIGRYCQTYLELKEELAALSPEEIAEMEEAADLSLDLSVMQKNYETYQRMLDSQDTLSCAKNLPYLIGTDVYRTNGANAELLKCLLFSVLSVVAGTLIIAPKLIRTSTGMHQLRRAST